MAQLNERQLRALFSGIDQSRVQILKGNSYVKSWDVRRWLNRIFGFGGWDVETLELVVASSNSVQDGTKLRHTVVYRAQVRLTIKDENGKPIAHYEDGSAGDAVNQPSIGDAHDNAMKTALSGALKRCAANLGDQFGLSLYNGGDIRPQVNWSMAYPKPSDETVPQDPPVQAVRTDDRESVIDETETEAESLAKLSDADLYAAAASGHYEVEEPAQQELMRRAGAGRPAAVQDRPQPSEIVRNGPPPSERDLVWQAMLATAEEAKFVDALPGQFHQSFGKPIEQGTVEEWKQATALMKEACA
jgi:hypothetical protein